MTRRILSMIMTLLLLCCCSAFAEGAQGPQSKIPDEVQNVLYRIVLRTDEGDTTLGSSVLFLEKSVLLTAAGCCRNGELYAVGPEGEHRIIARDILSDSGVALMEMETPAAAEPLTLSAFSTAGIFNLYGVDASGKLQVMPLRGTGRDMYHQQETLRLVGEEGLLPGAFMLDAQGQLLCVVIAQQAEGRGVYTALTSELLYSALTGEKDTEAFLPVKLSWEKGLLKISWEDAERTGGSYLITVSGGDNNYYTTHAAKAELRSGELAVPPGHTYYVQVQWVEEGAQGLKPTWSAMTSLDVPAEPFTRYGYTQECYLASAPAGQQVDRVLPPLEDVNVAALSDGKSDIYLQVRSAYDVSEKERLLMTVELIGPDGQFYYADLGYTFSPEHETQDGISVPVDALFAASSKFSGGSIRPGDYVLRYAFEGYRAGELAFTVKPGGEAPAQTVGAMSGVKAEVDKGLVTLSWDAASIPEGAKVVAHYFYEGNTYYTSQEKEPGDTTAVFFAIPGRSAMAWVVWSMEDKLVEFMPQRSQDMVIIKAQEASPYTLNGFTNHRLSVVASPDAAASEKGVYLPEAPITRDHLADAQMHFYFQTEDTYQTAELSSEHPLAIVLCTPDGQCYLDGSSYIFDPALQASDLWLMDITSLFADHVSLSGGKAWPSGEYTVLYCIDGQLAGEYAFALE